MFHPRQSGMSALISRALGKRIGLLLSAIARHSPIAGALIFVYLILSNPANRTRIHSALTASDFPQLALAALIFSALLMAVIYAFIHIARQILTACHRDE